VAISRRAFLAWAAGAIPAAGVVRRAHALSVAALSSTGAPTATLRALGDVVLPSALGTAGIDREVAAFRRWMTDYREHAELTHGYGTSRIRYSGPTPVTRWTSQLDALDAAGRKQFGAPFASLALSRREAVVRAALGGKLDRLPAVAEADHVAIALIAHFYGSSAATDLCYGAAIGREQCRPLAQSSREPLPIANSHRD
jgi:hypothetical protein